MANCPRTRTCVYCVFSTLTTFGQRSREQEKKALLLVCWVETIANDSFTTLEIDGPRVVVDIITIALLYVCVCVGGGSFIQ
jgi:hypothetical protein